jgi:hypothetical protein
MDSNENRPDFALILTDGAQRIEGSTRITISRDDSPDLTLPTGRLAASGFGYGAPFVETVPPGTYSTAVFVENIAALEDDGVTEKYDFEEFADRTRRSTGSAATRRSRPRWWSSTGRPENSAIWTWLPTSSTAAATDC